MLPPTQCPDCKAYIRWSEDWTEDPDGRFTQKLGCCACVGRQWTLTLGKGGMLECSWKSVPEPVSTHEAE